MVPIRSEETSEIIRAITVIFSYFGPPEQLHSDNGFSVFDVQEHLVKQHGRKPDGTPMVPYTTGSSYNPKAQNSVEAIHKPLRAYFEARAARLGDKHEWASTLEISQAEAHLRNLPRVNNKSAYHWIAADQQPDLTLAPADAVADIAIAQTHDERVRLLREREVERNALRDARQQESLKRAATTTGASVDRVPKGTVVKLLLPPADARNKVSLAGVATADSYYVSHPLTRAAYISTS